MQRMEQQCTAIHITQRVDPRQGYVANDEEEWGGGFSGLSMRITRPEQWCVRNGTATSAESKLANRAGRWVFVEGLAFFLSLPRQHLHVIFLMYLFLRRDPVCLGRLSKQHLYFWLLSEQAYSKYLSSRASSNDRYPEGLERKIHFL